MADERRGDRRPRASRLRPPISLIIPVTTATLTASRDTHTLTETTTTHTHSHKAKQMGFHPLGVSPALFSQIETRPLWTRKKFAPCWCLNKTTCVSNVCLCICGCELSEYLAQEPPPPLPPHPRHTHTHTW